MCACWYSKSRMQQTTKPHSNRWEINMDMDQVGSKRTESVVIANSLFCWYCWYCWYCLSVVVSLSAFLRLYYCYCSSSSPIVNALLSVALLWSTKYSSARFVNFWTKSYQAATEMFRQSPVVAWLELDYGTSCSPTYAYIVHIRIRLSMLTKC